LTESDLVRRILWRETPAASDGKLESAGASLQRSFARMTDALRNSMGAGGCSALLARAFALAEIAHPILKELRPRNGDSLCVDAIAASVDAHGIGEVTGAIEALVAAVIDILTRLIGEEMAARLIGGDDAQSSTRGARVS
jgi:hypothetical protein